MAQASFLLAYALLWQQARHSPQEVQCRAFVICNSHSPLTCLHTTPDIAVTSGSAKQSLPHSVDGSAYYAATDSAVGRSHCTFFVALCQK